MEWAVGERFLLPTIGGRGRAAALRPTIVCLVAAVWAIGCSMALFSGARAQGDPANRVVAVPFDQNAPDVLQFKKRSTALSAEPSTARQFGVPSDQFFAAINNDAPVERGRSVRAPGALVDELPKCEVESAVSDTLPRRGWFQVEYAKPCNLSLYCNWLFDPVVDRSSDARALEREFETRANGTAKLSDPAPEEDVPDEATDPEDPHLNDYAEISRTVILAGNRKCSLTRTCEGKDDPLCTAEFLETKASQIEIEQLGK
jgi:hypothetical protein